MNEFFKKLKIFLFGFGSASVAFLLFMFCGKKLHDNGSADAGIKDACNGIQGATDGLRETTDGLADTNGRFKKLITEIEATGEN